MWCQTRLAAPACCTKAAQLHVPCAADPLLLSRLDDETVTVSFDEVTTIADVDELLAVLNGGSKPDFSAQSLASEVCLRLQVQPAAERKQMKAADQGACSAACSLHSHQGWTLQDAPRVPHAAAQGLVILLACCHIAPKLLCRSLYVLSFPELPSITVSSAC